MRNRKGGIDGGVMIMLAGTVIIVLLIALAGCSKDPVSPPTTGEPTLGKPTVGEVTSNPVGGVNEK